MRFSRAFIGRTMLSPALAVLAACGGGGGSGSGSTTPVTPSTPAPVPVIAPAVTPTPQPVPAPTVLVVRAQATLAANVGPIIDIRVNGTSVGTAEVRSTELASYTFTAPSLHAGSKVELVYNNDAVIGSEDRNLFVAYLQSGDVVMIPSAPGVVYDRGGNDAAFDGLDTVPGQSEMTMNGALRMTWPTAPTTSSTLNQQLSARFLQQATFGPTLAEVDRVAAMGINAWLDEQMATPYVPDFVNHIQSKYANGDDWRPPAGSRYDPSWVQQKFWATAAASGGDQLRKRVAYALHHTFVVSQADGNLQLQARAYAAYYDMLNKHAFGNYRALLEDLALSPAMGLYLSHMRNRKEDPTVGRLPDENFAREIMQLFSIGLTELNADGSPQRNAAGQLIETYSNTDVMGMAKVFTGWSWAFPDGQLTDAMFLSGAPDYSTAKDQRIDLLPMKAYPNQHSTAQVQLFAGKPWATTIAANASASAALKQALDTLFQHPNVGPFIGRQLIQNLVTSQPSAAYVSRVSAAFNDNGKGVRGDMAAVVRAVLTDTEAHSPSSSATGRLLEPVLRTTQWMRAMQATSVSGEYVMGWDLTDVGQTALSPGSVFGYFRPGYVPPNTGFSANGITMPEFQILNEATAAQWVNYAQQMTGWGLGWTGSGPDVSSTYPALAAMSADGNVAGMIDHLNLLLLAGQMSSNLKADLLDAITTISSLGVDAHLNRARIAAFVVMSSPEYLVQR